MVIKQTGYFGKWLQGLRDKNDMRRLVAAIEVASLCGGFMDVKYTGRGIYEARFHFGPGYRIYYASRGEQIILLVAGGDKGSQRRDIGNARRINALLLEGREDDFRDGSEG
ncbi:type II toxin-antitoxin system RelE/ParE family toxin [Paratractidigestivibacter sp.]|uniref:type II toxin-antitoxin system RelE/ParE family toxin n=1 Tax=Paratractidigestivibacter sp. TaxID=2847316 RepID=UPI002ABE1771|nr:type II toxin-antitoxin system RelE/ParE family toxin [Paratractidigestivibacter sp.]